jgi:hypothetical protein
MFKLYPIKANDLSDAADFKTLMHANIISGSNHYLWARNTPVFSVLILENDHRVLSLF